MLVCASFGGVCVGLLPRMFLRTFCYTHSLKMCRILHEKKAILGFVLVGECVQGNNGERVIRYNNNNNNIFKTL